MSGRPLVIRGDARALPLPDSSVDLIVTSPPYFGLRAYTDGGEAYAEQIGSEPTPADYIDSLVECTREWVRVLKPTGSIFVNLNDKYSQYEGILKGHGRSLGRTERVSRGEPLAMPVSAPQLWGIPAKSLMLLPERYRIACVDQLGLIARAVILWHKPNGLPESATDRVRRSHEDWVHLTRQPRYYSAVDEIRDPASDYARPNGNGRAPRGGQRPRMMLDTCNPLGRLPGSVWEYPTEPLRVPDHLPQHFAAFPVSLPRRLVQGWSPPGICVQCGVGRRPVRARESVTASSPGNVPSRRIPGEGRNPITRHGEPGSTLRLERGYKPLGYACACPEPTAPTLPAVVLDPFGGTGTTALVASVLGRIGITVDRSGDYCRLARWRTTDPSERARALRVPKPPAQSTGQEALFDVEVAA